MRGGPSHRCTARYGEHLRPRMQNGQATASVSPSGGHSFARLAWFAGVGSLSGDVSYCKRLSPPQPIYLPYARFLASADGKAPKRDGPGDGLTAHLSKVWVGVRYE